MLKRKIAILLAGGALIAGIGVASALADDNQPPQSTPTVTTAENENEQGEDEQGAASDVTEAADDVETEATNPAADDSQGDEQDENDDAQEPDAD
jgi:hypothetical protein